MVGLGSLGSQTFSQHEDPCRGASRTHARRHTRECSAVLHNIDCSVISCVTVSLGCAFVTGTKGMMKLVVLLLVSVLSVNAFVLPGPTVAPLRATALAMKEAEPKPVPKKDWTLTLAGGTRTVDDVWKAQKKAVKAYVQKEEVFCDVKNYEKGWTTK